MIVAFFAVEKESLFIASEVSKSSPTPPAKKSRRTANPSPALSTAEAPRSRRSRCRHQRILAALEKTLPATVRR
ncbi:MAG: hypothetical protein ACK5TH_02480 [Prosthecobacter sp.]|jgi:hypothetical protein